VLDAQAILKRRKITFGLSILISGIDVGLPFDDLLSAMQVRSSVANEALVYAPFHDV